MDGVPLSTGTVIALLSRVPELTDADWELLDLRNDVSAFEALDEYYVVPVRAELRHRSSTIAVEVTDPDGWLPAMHGGTLRTEGYRFGLRQTASTIAIPHAGPYVVPLNEPSTETLLEADAITLDVSGGWFIGATQTVEPISGGALPDVLALASLSEIWNDRDATRREVVLDPRKRGTDPTATGRAVMRALLAGVIGGFTPTVLDIVDPYAVDAAMLRAVASRLPYGSTIRLACGDAGSDADYAAVHAATGIKIERYEPPASIPQHDRFVRVAGRLWSVGTSLHTLGRCFSAIIEVRDPATFGSIAAVVDACLAGPLKATS